MVGLAVDLGFLGGILSLEGGTGLDAAALAHRADLAGADLVVIPLGGDDQPGFTLEEARRVKSIVRKPVAVSVRGTRMLAEALSLQPVEVLFLSDHGGPVKLDIVDAADSPLAGATARVRAAGLLPVVSVNPEEAEILAAQDAGAVAVELCAMVFGAARTDDAALDGHRRIARAARTASDVGLRVRTGGGAAVPGRVSRLAEIPEVEFVRVSAGLLSGAFYEGIGAAVAALRAEVERGARRGDRIAGEEEE